MRFYQAVFKLDGEWASENLSKGENPQFTGNSIKNKLHEQTRLYNEEIEDAFFFVADADSERAKCCMITEHCDDFDRALNDYVSLMHGTTEQMAVKEITSGSCERLMHCSLLGHFEWGEIADRFYLNLNEGFGTYVEERLIKPLDKEEVYRKAGKLLSNSELTSELDRIYEDKIKASAKGHPVHYMIRLNDPNLLNRTKKVLLSALYAQKRIESLRYCEISVEERGLRMEKAERVYKSSAGGTVVICFDIDETDDGGNYACNFDYISEQVCSLVKKYRNKTLTIFCLDEENIRLKRSLTEHLGTLTTVELSEDYEYDDRCREFLAQLAEKNSVTPDDALLSRVKPNTGYKTEQLINYFDEWYSEKLKEEVYPQYSSLKAANEIFKDAPAKGSAADELKAMTGLTEAKKIIWRALDYFKAQKLFADFGMKEDRPSMHMVFTGSPGTAKTTVARLFARILRDNGVLERGVFLELGRSDLVGKYVGWTAPMIKKKFTEAKGGVIFIDEAYSLLDDRSGSFGDEAINTIVQEMENHRDDVIAIFAGYTQDMEDFLARNPGLSSRIAFHVPFDDYNVEELLAISDYIAEGKGLVLTEGAKDKLAEIYRTARAKENFGNGRYVRNLIEKAKMAQAQRLLKMDLNSVDEEDVKRILDSDVEMPAETSPVRRIGFHTSA